MDVAGIGSQGTLTVTANGATLLSASVTPPLASPATLRFEIGVLGGPATVRFDNVTFDP